MLISIKIIHKKSSDGLWLFFPLIYCEAVILDENSFKEFTFLLNV